jgi:hypothetical protein
LFLAGITAVAGQAEATMWNHVERGKRWQAKLLKNKQSFFPAKIA